MVTFLHHLIEARNAFIRRHLWLCKLFVGKNNQIIIIQWPNVPLSLAIIFAVLAAFVRPPLQFYAHGGYVLFILIWAVIEVVKGDSLFRKMLGAAFIVYEVISLFF